MHPAEFRHSVDNELLNEICAVSDAGDERRAGNREPPQWEARADRADQPRGHGYRKQRKLPDGSVEIDILAFPKPERIHNQRESRYPEPNRRLCQPLPQLRPEFFYLGNHNSEHVGIEPRPGWIVNPCLKAAKRNAAIN